MVTLQEARGRTHYKYLMEGTTLREWCIKHGCSYASAWNMVRKGKSNEEIKKKLLENYEKQYDIYQAAAKATREWKQAKTDYEMKCIRSEFEADWGQHPKYDAIWDEITLGTFTFNGEIWKRIAGTKNYECSDQGRVRKRLNNGLFRILHPYAVNRKNKKGKYNRKYLSIKIRDAQMPLARIIAEAFIPHDYKHDVVFIKDGKWKHIWANNLEWVTKEEMGAKTGYSPKRSKEVELLDENGQVIQTFRSARAAGKELFISYQTALDYCHKKVKKPLLNLRFKE